MEKFIRELSVKNKNMINTQYCIFFNISCSKKCTCSNKSSKNHNHDQTIDNSKEKTAYIKNANLIVIKTTFIKTNRNIMHILNNTFTIKICEMEKMMVTQPAYIQCSQFYPSKIQKQQHIIFIYIMKLSVYNILKK